jgi:TRAP-type mannitol/chloroaromatic compound transport system substrate-binding protein
MKRRSFLTSAGIGAAATTIAAPAIAQSAPEIQWRCASSFPKSLDTLFGTGDEICRRVAEATDGKFQIRQYAAGEIVPPLQVLDAVQAGTVQCGHSVGYYYVGKDPTFAFEAALPFGLNSRQQTAWMTYGPGKELMAEFFAGYNIVSFPAGNTGAQMAGWFRKEIKTLEDIKGLKMRIGGYAGQVLAKLGLVPQQIGGSDVYPALEKGTIDATEWVGPYDDEKLGFYKVAKYYYYPGWWEGGPQVSYYVNKDALEALPKHYRAVLEAACAAGHVSMQAKYDVQNMEALKSLIGKGTILKPFPKEIMQAAYEAAFELYNAEAAKNEKFRKVYEAWKKFRDEEYLWFRVAEYGYDSFVYTAPKPKAG